MFSALRAGSARLVRTGLDACKSANKYSGEISGGYRTVVGGGTTRCSLRWKSDSLREQVVSTSGQGFREQAGYYLQCYKELSKFRLSALVVSTAGAGYVLGSGEEIQWAGLFWTSLGTMAASACANCVNQIMEMKYDAMMCRTMKRPLPSGRVSRAHAMAFALATGVGGVSLLYWKTNFLTASLGAANIAIYTMAYTPLKRISVVNTWVGAVVGAIPPLMGWAAASGKLDAGSYLLATALYFWQLPHFMALAWMCKDDYARGKYRMLSLIDQTGRRTAACALRNCIYLLPLGPLAVAMGVVEWPFAWEATAISAYFSYAAMQFVREPAAARTCFRGSLLHLPLFMGALIVHRIPRTEDNEITFCQVLEQTSASMLYWTSVLGVSTRSTPEKGNKPTQSADAMTKKAQLLSLDFAPFPFLPLPPMPQCPSRMCAEEEGSRTCTKPVVPSQCEGAIGEKHSSP